MRFSAVSLASLALVAAVALPGRAELTPNQVAIIAMAESETSRELAEYYAKARGIPESHIFLIEGRVDQRISRYQWEDVYRPAIRNWLQEQSFSSEIRCLVTMWDVPLEIAILSASSPAVKQRLDSLQQARAHLVGQSATLIRLLHTRTGDADAAASYKRPADDIALEALHAQFADAMRPAQKWLRSKRTSAERRQAGEFIDRVLVTVSGNQGMLRLASPRGTSTRQTAEQKSRLAYLVGRSEGYQRGMQALNLLRGTTARDEQAIELAQAMGGLFGAIRYIDQQFHLLDKNFTAASFDSELSMLRWPDPPVLSWVANPWHHDFDTTPLRRRNTLMVSRLSAPRPEIVRRMIDDAVAAEKTSLSGKVYIDARGLPYDSRDPKKNDVFARYDQSLRDLAARLRKHTSLEVVLDNKDEVFAPGTCPEAALYCGWRSSERYVDSFTWSTGALGYHLSDHEASWLQLNDDSRVQHKAPWCPAMLADGACATLGASREAYLSAFPLPDDFFSVLLTGKYTLVETYYRTVPFISWTVLVIGDPLYNPYKQAPKLSSAALPGRTPAAASRPQAKKPSDRPSSDERKPIKPVTPRAKKPAKSDTPLTLPGLN